MTYADYRNYILEKTGEKTGVSKKAALRMFFDAGWDTEESLKKAFQILNKLKAADSSGDYYYADEVNKTLNKFKRS